MNVVGVVVLASPPRDPIRSKRHNGQRLRALHTYNATTPPPPWSNRVRWSCRWDQQHDGVVLMVESICGQGFAYTCEVKEDKQISRQTRARKYYKRQIWHRMKQFSVLGQNLKHPPVRSFYSWSHQFEVWSTRQAIPHVACVAGKLGDRSASIGAGVPRGRS
jgi:hypothetical protein